MQDITTIRYDDSHKDDILQLSERLRKIDEYECVATGALDGYHGLLLSLYEKDMISYLGYINNEPVWAYGIHTVNVEGLGYCIWFLGTDAVDHNKRYFLTESKRIIRKWQREYGQLWNMVSQENTRAIRWLRWLGAEFSESNVEGFILFTLPAMSE